MNRTEILNLATVATRMTQQFEKHCSVQRTLQTLCLSMLGLSCLPLPFAIGQPFKGDGFRLVRNDAQQAVHAESMGEWGIHFLLDRQ